MDLHRPQRSLRAASRLGITARHVHSFHALSLPLFPLSSPLVLALTQLSTVSQSIADSPKRAVRSVRRPSGTVKAAAEAAASRVASGKQRRMEGGRRRRSFLVEEANSSQIFAPLSRSRLLREDSHMTSGEGVTKKQTKFTLEMMLSF